MLGSAVWIVPAVFATISQIAQHRLNGDPPPNAAQLIWTAGDWLVYAILAPLIFFVSNRWPVVRSHLAKRMAIHLVFALLTSVAWSVSGKLLQLALALTLRPPEAEEFLQAANFWQRAGMDLVGWIFNTLPFGAIVYVCVAGMAHAVRYFVEMREREVQMARLAEQLTGARLAALQSQLNPHFLFNSLNTIAVLTRDGDSVAATRVIEQLSEVLRSTLGRAETNEVSLDDELELVRQYLAVEQARFSDRLRPEFNIDPALLSAVVPNFALQHLVENAIRHGIARRIDSGRVVISARRDGDTLELAVEDDGAGLGAPGNGKGHGLENTRERLRTLYGDRASLDVTAAPGQGTIARLRVPYREMILEPGQNGGA
jgi:signal transduction histidine kinase